jgi:hypothetical protein
MGAGAGKAPALFTGMNAVHRTSFRVDTAQREEELARGA